MRVSHPTHLRFLKPIGQGYKLMDIALIGFDLDIIDLIESSSIYRLYGFIDNHDLSRQFGLDHITYLGTDECRDQYLKKNPDLNFVLGMDNPGDRKKILKYYNPKHFVTLVSHLSHVSQRANIGKGSILQHRTTIMPFAKIGQGCLLNCNASIHHESVLGDYSTMAPGSILLGRVKVGAEAYIGAGAIVKENCTIGKGAVIGAGAVVVKDVPQNTRVVGVPAKKQHE